jgi:hypothetical protein
VVTYGVYREGCRAELRGVGEIALPRGAEEVAEALERGCALIHMWWRTWSRCAGPSWW